MFRLLRFRPAVTVGVVAFVAAVVALAIAGFGGAQSESVGDTVNASGSVNDEGATYNFTLVATEQQPRMGDVGHSLSGPRLSLCTISGPEAQFGTTPLAEVRCGFAGLQAVSIEGCKADIQTHGYSHSDFPFDPIYLGTMTMEIRFEKKGPSDGKLKVTVHTPKGKNEVEGRATGSFAMSSCP